ASYAIGSSVPGALRGRRSAAVSLTRVEDMLLAEPTAARQAAAADSADDLLSFVKRQSLDAHRAAERLAKLAGGGDAGPYPASTLAERLKLIARLLKSDVAARVCY